MEVAYPIVEYLLILSMFKFPTILLEIVSVFGAISKVAVPTATPVRGALTYPAAKPNKLPPSVAVFLMVKLSKAKFLT